MQSLWREVGARENRLVSIVCASRRGASGVRLHEAEG